MEHTKHEWSVFTRDYFALFISTFGFFISLTILIPITPLYAAKLGATEAMLGLITGVFAAGAVVARIIVAPYTNRHPKLFLIMGSFMFFIAPIFYIFSNSPFELLIASIFHGIGIAIFTISAMTLVSNMAPQSRQGEVMGVYGLFVATAHATGPFLGGFLEELIGFTGTFMVAAGFALLSGLLCVLVKTAHSTQAQSVATYQGYHEVLRNYNVRLAAFGIMVLTIAYGVLLAYGPLYLKNIGMSTARVGMFFTLIAVGMMIGRPTMGKLSDTKGRVPVIIFTMILIVLSVYSLAILVTVVAFYLTALVYGFSFGAANSVQTALTIDTINPQHRSSAFAVYSASFDMGISVGSIGIGFIAEIAALSYSVLLQVTSGILILGIGIFVYFSLLKPKNRVSELQ